MTTAAMSEVISVPDLPVVSRRPVGWWLLAVVLMVLVQVVLGGITRLTDSGLSITEWKPLLGVIPPTDETSWADAFGKYQQIPQYKILKSHLTLEQFKAIYFWEWFHRLWGRLLGVAFVVPLLVFWRQRRLDGLMPRLLVLLGLGGLQGVMGWIMVASGLQDLVYVSHLRLAAHLLLAALLLAALLWVALEQLVPAFARGGSSRLRTVTIVLLGAVGVQLTWGAFMAGLKAALAAPTWPSINGAFLPVLEGAWWNDPLAIHFVHRNLAYLIAAGVAAWWWAARKTIGLERHVVLGVVAAQVLLGIFTVLAATAPDRFLVLGVVHQLVAMLLMLGLVAAVFRLSPANAR